MRACVIAVGPKFGRASPATQGTSLVHGDGILLALILVDCPVEAVGVHIVAAQIAAQGAIYQHGLGVLLAFSFFGPGWASVVLVLAKGIRRLRLSGGEEKGHQSNQNRESHGSSNAIQLTATEKLRANPVTKLQSPKS